MSEVSQKQANIKALLELKRKLIEDYVTSSSSTRTSTFFLKASKISKVKLSKVEKRERTN